MDQILKSFQSLNSLLYVGRNAIAAPATGIGKRYKKEQSDLLEKLFEK